MQVFIVGGNYRQGMDYANAKGINPRSVVFLSAEDTRSFEKVYGIKEPLFIFVGTAYADRRMDELIYARQGLVLEDRTW